VIRWLAFIDRHAGLILAAMLMLCALLMTIGCGDSRSPQSDGSSDDGLAGATLGSVGATLVWIGGISAAAGVALRVIAVFYPPLAPLAAVFGFAAIGGLAVTATGSSLQWLADNPWLMVLAVAASLGSVVWWYWPRIRRALDRRLDGKV